MGLMSLAVVKFMSNLVLNLELSSFRREVRMSLSKDSSTGTSTQLWIHSLMKTAGLRLSGPVQRRRRRTA